MSKKDFFNDLAEFQKALAELQKALKEKTVQPKSVNWDDVVGLEEAKAELIDAIETPYKHPQLYRAYGRKPTRGVLLYGPPGCGKTMLGKAAATALGDPDGFIYVKGPELLNKWVGETEERIRNLFQRTRQYQVDTRRRAIIFLDEADALLSYRGKNIMADIAVPAFLTEMDGIEDSGAVVLLSTNRSNDLDPAVVRDGRVDRRVHVGRPKKKDALKMFEAHFKDIPMWKNLDAAPLAAREMFAERRVLFDVHMKDGRVVPMRVSDVVNGAAVASVAERAKSTALQRDVKCNFKTASGVTKQDVVDAVDALAKSLTGVSHAEPLYELVGDDPVARIVARDGRAMRRAPDGGKVIHMTPMLKEREVSP